MAVLTLVDVDVGREYRVFSETDAEGNVHVYATIGYRVTTAEGRDFSRSVTVELTGVPKTRAVALFQDIKVLAKAQEGIA